MPQKLEFWIRFNDSWPETRRTLDRLPDPRRLLACWVAAINLQSLQRQTC